MVKADTGIDVFIYDNMVVLQANIRGVGIDIKRIDQMGLTTLFDYFYEKISRPKLINPTFLYNYPIILKPFARRNTTHSYQVDAFQLVANDWELVNSHFELIDSIFFIRKAKNVCPSLWGRVNPKSQQEQ